MCIKRYEWRDAELPGVGGDGGADDCGSDCSKIES